MKQGFVEKDYWMTLVLMRLAKSPYSEVAVFKGGTSLSKGYQLIDRFSEDVDIAIIKDQGKTGNEVKTMIRVIEKEITKDLYEFQMKGVTSKGSRFRKSVFSYNSTDNTNKNNKLMVEVNSFANPFPFQKRLINSFVSNFLMETGNQTYIARYELEPFEVNVLNKEQTLLEKMAALIRFSFDENPTESLSGKIRHFYDLCFLVKDPVCKAFVDSKMFKTKFDQLMEHDRDLFDQPAGWQSRDIAASPLLNDFEGIWKRLKNKYQNELSALAYRQIPSEREVYEIFSAIAARIL